MKKIAFVGITMFLMAISGYAIANESNGISQSLDVTYLTSYVGTAGAVFYDKPVFQASYTVEKNGWYGTLWGSAGFDEFNDDFGDEIDLSGGKTISFGKFSLDICVLYYLVYDLGETADDVIAGCITLEYDNFLKPFLSIESDYVLDESDGGTYYVFGFKPSIKNIGLEISISGNDGMFGARPQFFEYGRIGINYSYRIKNGVTLVPKIFFQRTFQEHANSLSSNNIWGGISVNF